MTARRRWTLLATVAAGVLLITLDNSILFTALPTLIEELGASANERLWIVNAYPLLMAGLLLGAGTLGDRYGHRRMFLIGLVIFGSASLAAAFSPNPEALIAARAALGIGAAAMMPATLALIRITFTDARERNMAVAVWGSLAVVGSAVGPIASGILLRYFSWGSVFLINVPVVILAILAALIVAPPSVTDRSRSWDLLSSIQVMIGLSGLVFAIKEATKSDRSWPLLLVAFAATVIGLATFARRQGRLTYPLLDFSIFRNRIFTAGVLGAMISLFVLAGIEYVTSQRFQLVKGYSPLESGGLLVTIAAGSLVTALIGGAVLHRVGLAPLISGGMAVGTIGVVLALIGIDSGLGWMIAGFVVLGAGFGAVISVASTAIIGSAPVHRAGMASSMEEVSYEFGNLTAVALLGSLLTEIYTSRFVLPNGAPEAARDSIESAHQLAGSGDQANHALLDAAGTAFDSGYLIVMIVTAIVAALGAIVTGLLLRRADMSALHEAH